MRRLSGVFLACWLAGALPAAAASSRPAADPLETPRRLFESGRYAEVIPQLSSEMMQKLGGKDLQRATLYLATSYERASRLDKALSVYQLGIKLFPKNIDLLLGLARLLHTAQLDEQAQPLYHKILELEPDNISAHLGLAVIDRTLGLLERSAEHYEMALERLRDNAAVWRDYAEVLYEQKEYKTAELAIARSLELSPKTIDSTLVLARIQRAKGELQEAVKTIEKVVALTGREPELVLTYALWLIEAKRFPAARAQAESALRGEPSNPLARWILGRLDLQAGRRESAAAQFRAAAAAAGEDSFIAKTSAAFLKELQ